MPHTMETEPPTGVGEFPAAMDQSVQSLGRAWVATAVPASAWNSATPQANLTVPWVELDSAGLPAVFLLRTEGTGSGPLVFCTAKTGLVCGTPSMRAQGTPSATQASGFTLRASPARSCKSGVLLYNQNQQAPAMPFNGGALCVAAAGLRRAAPIESGGTPGNNCDGAFTIDLNSFVTLAWSATGAHRPRVKPIPQVFFRARAKRSTARCGVAIRSQRAPS